MTSVVNIVSEEQFALDVLNSDIPVIVDFWAPWCGPCKMLAPVLDDLSTKLEGQVKIVKVNVDEIDTISSTYGVRGIPTLLKIQDGVVEGTRVGVLTKMDLIKLINE